VADTLVREIREELDCTVSYVATLHGRSPISPQYVLTAHQVRIVSGEPLPREHDAIRWLGPEELGDVDWLLPDRPFLPEIAALLAEGRKMEGGR
jgi:8-oxo-dGTP diphosphatase